MSSAATAGGNGQAPTQPAAPVGGNGQAPTPAQANNTGTPQSAGQNGQAPAAIDPQQQLTADDVKRMRQELDEARRDAAKAREELKRRDDAQLTEQQKRDRDYAETQTQLLEARLRNQQLEMRDQGHTLASQLGITNIGLALAAVQIEHGHELAFDEKTNQPTNLEKLLKQVLADYPVLAAAQSGQPTGGLPGQPSARPAANSGGATNPGAGARAGTLSREIIAAMSPGEYQARHTEVMQWLAANQGRQ